MGILILAVVVLGIAVVFLVIRGRVRTRGLQEWFGPEYDLTVVGAGERRAAEAELEARVERHDELELRRLPAAARKRYRTAWLETQARFVDAPGDAVREAENLVEAVMQERGYPVDEFDQEAADLSVEHPRLVENFREAHRVLVETEAGRSTTEQLRQAFIHYRVIFEELLATEEPAATKRRTR